MQIPLWVLRAGETVMAAGLLANVDDYALSPHTSVEQLRHPTRAHRLVANSTVLTRLECGNGRPGHHFRTQGGVQSSGRMPVRSPMVVLAPASRSA